MVTIERRQLQTTLFTIGCTIYYHTDRINNKFVLRDANNKVNQINSVSKKDNAIMNTLKNHFNNSKGYINHLMQKGHEICMDNIRQNMYESDEKINKSKQ
jgi:hypothetical protein